MKKRELEYLALGAALNSQPAPRTEYVTRTVHEHRAPTDESIRLAREYEEKAWNIVRDRVTEPLLNISANYVVCETAEYDRKTHIFFKVNNKPVRISVDAKLYCQAKCMEVIASRVAEDILKLLMEGKK